MIDLIHPLLVIRWPKYNSLSPSKKLFQKVLAEQLMKPRDRSSADHNRLTLVFLSHAEK